MTNQHPITPPEELVEEWGQNVRIDYSDMHWGYEQILCAMAARWGADEELKACRFWVRANISIPEGEELHAVRRPKPPSLKEQALMALEEAAYMADDAPPQGICSDQIDIIRRALEALDD